MLTLILMQHKKYMREKKSIHEIKKIHFNREAWMYYYQFFKPYKSKLIGISIGFVAISFLIFPSMWLSKYIVDIVIPQKEISLFIIAGFAVLAFRLLNGGLNALFTKQNNIIFANISVDMRKNLMDKFFLFSTSYYTRKDIGILHSQIIQNTERVSRMGASIVSKLIPSIFISIALLSTLAFLNIYLFLLIILYLPIIYLCNKYIGKKLQKYVLEHQNAFDLFSKETLYLFKFMDLIKIQSTEADERKKHTEILEELKDKTISKTHFETISSRVQNVLVALIGVFVLVIGAISYLKNMMTLGELMVFYIAVSRLQNVLAVINNSYLSLLVGNESIATIFEVSNQQNVDPYIGSIIFDFDGNIKFENVSFSYEEKLILNDISFEIRAGERIGFVGENGSGKSTIIQLILGFYKPNKGNCYSQNISFHEIDFKDFRKQIGVVSQHVKFIEGTIAENIIYGSDEVSVETFNEVLELAKINDLISKLNKGIDTNIGENGILLSGGERQKIAIARALVRKPKLLILDEPTNHLDHQTVFEIINNLKKLHYNPAMLIISHDSKVIEVCDEVFELKQGKLSNLKSSNSIQSTHN
jgi:ATP-binding cassette, subfamily B, bacterial